MAIRVLVVDDLRRFDPIIDGGEITYARRSADAIHLLSRNKDSGYEQVWLDHDLGENDDIRVVVRWILEYKPKIGNVMVQSMNPVGAEWIVRSLEKLYPTRRVNSPYLRVPS